ncbi:MAG: hypothetical protein E5Y89_21615 [Mesorhizobium sp.]|nr:MAG: hypothetical protein E5Y89_21615 [Mesorhizobium sp.]
MERRFGRLDVLVNNGAVHYALSARALRPDRTLGGKTFETYVVGAWRMAFAFVPLLSASGHGRLVIVSPEAGSLASMNAGAPGVLHGNRTYLLQNSDGQIMDGHSISAGLDYPGVGPEHSWLRDSGRVEYVPILDDEALEAFQLTTRVEGIIPALESAHAIAHAMKIVPAMDKDQIVIVNLSGRGDKDVHTVANMLGMEI